MSTAEPFLELRHVSRRFGKTVALRDVSLAVAAGECVAVFGANGAGKTTMLRTMATLARPTRGTVRAFGVDAFRERAQVRGLLGVVAHQPYVYPELTCVENLRFFAVMFGVDPPAPAIENILDIVGLTERGADRAATLSRGLLQRLNVARALIHNPALLILDEPDTGLDSPGREILADVITRQVERGASVVLTTHAIDFGTRVATRTILLRQGRLVHDRPAGPESASEIAVLLQPAAQPA